MFCNVAALLSVSWVTSCFDCVHAGGKFNSQTCHCSASLIATQQKYDKLKPINSSTITHCPLMSSVQQQPRRSGPGCKPAAIYLFLITVPAFIIQPLATTVSNKPPVASWLNDRSWGSILGDERRPQNNRQHISHEETQHWGGRTERKPEPPGTGLS